MNLVNDNDSKVLVNIIATVFPDVTIYENDVPQDFDRPCFLIIRPDKNTTTRELTKTIYEETKVFTIYAFDKLSDDMKSNIDTISQEMESTKHSFIDYLMGEPKHLIPNTDNRYLTVELANVEADDVNAVSEFTIRTKRILPRNLRKPKVNKIMEVVNNGTVIATGKE